MSQRDPVIVNNREGSSSGALVAGIVAVLLILVAVWYFGLRTEDDADIDIDITVPETAITLPLV